MTRASLQGIGDTRCLGGRGTCLRWVDSFDMFGAVARWCCVISVLLCIGCYSITRDHPAVEQKYTGRAVQGAA